MDKEPKEYDLRIREERYPSTYVADCVRGE